MLVRILLAVLAIAIIAFPSHAADSALVFETTRVTAPVAPNAASVWVVSADSSTTTEIIADTDGDGWVELNRAIDASASVWVIDISSGRLMTGKRDAAFPSPFAFPGGMFFPDQTSAQAWIVYPRTTVCRFIWVRPGVGAWETERSDGDTSDRDEQANGRALFRVSDFASLPGSLEPPAGIKATDVLLGVESSTTWFGDAIGDRLVTTGAGVLDAPAEVHTLESDYNLRFVVARRSGTEGTVSVKYATEDGTAIAGQDYQATSGTLVFGPGQHLQQVNVIVNSNGVLDGSRTFRVRFSEPSGTILLGASTVVNVLDDEPLQRLTVVPVSLQEGDAPVTTAQVEIVLEGREFPRRVPVSATWGASDDTGRSSQGTLTFAEGETSKTITISYSGNVSPDYGRRLSIGFGNLQNLLPPDPYAPPAIRIVDDDFAEISLGDITVRENEIGAGLPIHVPMGGPSIQARYTITGGTATAGTDYVAKSGTLFVNDAGYISFSFPDDLAPEPDEWFTIVLSDVTGAILRKATGYVTIVDDDPAVTRTPTIVIDDWQGSEAEDATFTIHLSSPTSQEVLLNATVRVGTAGESVDVVGGSTTIRIPPGVTTHMFVVDLVDDSAVEQREEFTVELSGAVNATIARGVASGTIDDDDDRLLPFLTIEPIPVVEVATQFASIVYLSEPQAGFVTVLFETEDGTAKDGSDYYAMSGRLVFSPGETSALLQVGITSDDIGEPNETFKIHLYSPVGATVAEPSASITILDDDPMAETKRRRGARH